MERSLGLRSLKDLLCDLRYLTSLLLMQIMNTCQVFLRAFPLLLCVFYSTAKFIHSFNKSLLSACPVPGTVLRIGNSSVSKTDIVLAFIRLYMLVNGNTQYINT